MIIRRRTALQSLAAALAIPALAIPALAGRAAAQDLTPGRPVTLIVPTAA